MKILFKLSSLIIVLTLILSVFTFSASAANSATLFFSKDTIKVGDDVTVSVVINPNKKMYAVSFYLQYDESILKYKSGSGVGNAGVLKVVESPSGTQSERYEFKFTALKAGTSYFTVTDCVYEQLGDDGATTVDFGGASAKMTVKDPALSNNANLKSLKVSGYKLSPAFSPNKTSYKVTVPNDIKKVNISAKTEDSNASVKSVEGNTKLQVGKNTVTVSVEAADGTLKKYTIKVTRLESEEVSSDNENSSDTQTDSDKILDDTDQETEEIDIPKDSLIETTVTGSKYYILTKLPKEILFEGFTTKEVDINGYTVEIAVDEDENYSIFYLKSDKTKEISPYLYDQELQSFEKLKYITFGKNYYIFSQIPKDYQLPESLYASSVNIGGFTVESYTNSDMYDFHYIYCFANGEYGLYRFDTLEETLQRYPEFSLNSVDNKNESGSFFERFLRLSTNGKVIFIGFILVGLGILALFAILMFHSIKKALNRQDDIFLMDYNDDFDAIEVKKQ